MLTEVNINLKEELFARRPKTDLSPSELNSEGKGQALVLRYAGCQLRESQCPLCYAWRYAWDVRNGYSYNLEQTLFSLHELSALAKKKIVWIRIQGGEPLLTYQRILSTLEYAKRAVREVHISGFNYYPITRAVIQTNALTFAKLNRVQVNSIRKHLEKSSHGITGLGRIIFEVSFKSSNSPNILPHQVEAYKVLLEDIIMPLWKKDINNIAIYPIAGLGPSIDFHNTWLIPIEPSGLPDEYPLFFRGFWKPSFKKLIDEFVKYIVPKYATYHDFRTNPRTGYGGKIAIEELEPTKFQTAWISRYAKQSGQPPIYNLLRRRDGSLDRQWCSRVLFGRNTNWLNITKAIPVATHPERLLELVKSMNKYFYPSHPIGHYPYL